MLTSPPPTAHFPTHQIEKDKASVSFAELRVDDMTEIHVFNARNKLPERMANIKALAKEPISEETCSSLLSQLLTSCHKDSCTSANTDMYQQSVNQVCSFVDTQIKVKTKTVGQFFDFQRYTVQLGTPHSSKFETPLDEKRAVACCKDDVPVDEEETWYKSPISRHDTCPYALRQRWTGDAPILLPYEMQYELVGGVTNTYEDYSPQSYTWTLKGEGAISGEADSMLYASTEIKGETDLDIKIRIQRGLDSSVVGHRGGLMIRESLDPSAKQFSILLQGNIFTTYIRPDTGANLRRDTTDGGLIKLFEGATWLRIVRSVSKNSLRTLYSTHTNPAENEWTQLMIRGGSNSFLGHTVYVGIAIGASSNDELVASKFTVNGGVEDFYRLTANEIGATDTFEHYSPPSDTWTMKGKGQINAGVFPVFYDFINYASTEMQGSTPTKRKDFDIRINVQSNSPDSPNENHRSGLMVRGSLNRGARNFALMLQGNQLQTSYRDNTRTGSSSTKFCGDKIPVEEGIWLRITRFGTSYRSWYSTHTNPSSKESWKYLCHHQFSRDDDWDDYMVSGSVHVGIAIGSGMNDVFVGRNFTIYGNCESNECMSDDGYPAIGTPPVLTKVEGYTSYNQRICNNDNQFFEVDGFGEEELLENDFIRISDISGCASKCDVLEDCSSFDFFGNSCRLSSSCDHYSLTDPNPASIWYFKHIPPPGYEYFESVRCSDSGDLRITNTNTLQECANLCTANHQCASIAYQKKGSTQCLLSSTCTDYDDMVDDEDGWNAYVKLEDALDEDTCRFLPYTQSEVRSLCLCCLFYTLISYTLLLQQS